MQRVAKSEIRSLVLVALALTNAGCAVRNPAILGSSPLPALAHTRGANFRERGEASYYASSLQSQKTASGELYDGAKLTAAHRTLPFGTIVKVTNLSNAKSVNVRINDRGPFSDGRIIDLSSSAAAAIGIQHDGVAPVELVVPERSRLQPDAQRS